MKNQKTNNHFTLALISVFLISSFAIEAFSQTCSNLNTTNGKFSETVNLNSAVSNELGSGFSIADWNDLKSISNIDAWISCMGLQKDQTFMVTKDGNYKIGGNRQYYVHYSPTGLPYAGFAVHDKIGNKLFLGSWSGLDMNILAIKKK